MMLIMVTRIEQKGKEQNTSVLVVLMSVPRRGFCNGSIPLLAYLGHHLSPSLFTDKPTQVPIAGAIPCLPQDKERRLLGYLYRVLTRVVGFFLFGKTKLPDHVLSIDVA